MGRGLSSTQNEKLLSTSSHICAEDDPRGIKKNVSYLFLVFQATRNFGIFRAFLALFFSSSVFSRCQTQP